MMNAFTLADEVKILPSLELLPPANTSIPILKQTHIYKSNTNGSTNRNTISRKVTKDSRDSDNGSNVLPGVLKTAKPGYVSQPGGSNTAVNKKDNKGSIFVGYNASNIHLDSSSKSYAPISSTNTKLNINNNNHTSLDFATLLANMHESNANANTHNKNARNRIGSADSHSNNSDKHTRTAAKADPIIEELRNYTVLMDRYSLHNFIIYEGMTLKSTPEFQSFQRAYSIDWGAISSLIKQLEELMVLFEIKLAIINGPKLSQLASLNLSSHSKEMLYECISNFDQLQNSFTSIMSADNGKQYRALIMIQSVMRRKLKMMWYKNYKLRLRCAIIIQSHARLMLHKMDKNIKLKRKARRQQYETVSTRMKGKMLDMWRNLDAAPAYGANSSTLSAPTNDEFASINAVGTIAPYNTSYNASTRLFVIIPTITAAEYLRLEMQNFQALQNTIIPSLYILSDPDVHIVYVSPIQMTSADMTYHERLLSVLGISTYPKRLHVIVPELIQRLPQHLSISLVLWCSPHALKRLQGHIRRYSSNAVIMPSSVSWVEKRIAAFLDIPLLAPDSDTAETLSCRSYAKRVFMDSSVNVPVGAHDINNFDDILISLSRLIASSLDVKRWLLRLNYDYNGESVAYLDVSKISVVEQLRNEQHQVSLENEGNVSSWFSRQCQMSVRQRLIVALKKELHHKAKILRKDIYPSWDMYMKHVKQIGMTVEAAPLEPLGSLNGYCFINPVSGDVQFCGGADVIADAIGQEQGYIFPQTLTPITALIGAVNAIAKVLYDKHNVVGYVTVKFESYWDAFQSIPRLWAKGLQFGMSPSFSSLGAATIAINSSKVSLPNSLVPDYSVYDKDRHFIHIPIAIHTPLKSSRDDVFFKFCKIRGITFDVQSRTGVLFFLIDAISGGAICVICIDSSRQKVIDLCLKTLQFITQQFGKDKSEDISRWNNISSIITSLKKIKSKDVEGVQ